MVDSPSTPEELRRDLGRALSLIDAKRRGYERAREYGLGTRTEIGGSKVQDRIIAQSAAAPVSFAHIPVEVISEKIELASITAPEAAAKSALERWMDAHDVDAESEDWIFQACMLGDYYVILDPQVEDINGRALVESSVPLGSSPFDTIVIYDRRTQREAEYGLHYWDSGTKNEPQTSVTLFYDDACVRMVSQPGTKGDHAEDYVLDYNPATGVPEDAWIFHDGGRMLIKHLAIGGKPYGVPVHRKAWGPQDAITKISANNLVNVDAQGLPSRWALLDPAAEVDDDIDDDFGTDGPTTSSANSDGRRGATTDRRVRTMPGAIAMLRGVKSVGTFDAGDSGSFLKNLDWYVRAMAVACGIPLFEFDLNGEQPSGEARRRAEGRANRKAAKIKAGSATAFFRDLADTVLGLAGLEGRVSVAFNPSETSTDKDGLELVALKVKAGVPVRQALLEAGYGDELVNEWYPEGSAKVSPDLLAIVAEALGKLGTAQSLGVITADEVREMLPEILTAARGEGPTVTPLRALPGVVTDPGSRSITA